MTTLQVVRELGETWARTRSTQYLERALVDGSAERLHASRLAIFGDDHTPPLAGGKWDNGTAPSVVLAAFFDGFRDELLRRQGAE